MTDRRAGSSGEAISCTYRIQLRDGMNFAGVAARVPYLERLGVSHLYLAPPFTAFADSTHGYDVADANELDPRLGGAAGFEALTDALETAGIGLILDIVPNHMAAHHANPWWWDVLAKGEASRFARVFDIAWANDPDRKVVLPVLAAPAAELSAAGVLAVAPDPASGEPVLTYGTARFPLRDPATGIGPATPAVLDAQAYRLVPWRAAEGFRNYRRFFDIDGLVAVRAEDPEIFELTHKLVLDLVQDGHVQGLRIDHIDGLTDPADYLERLRARLAEVAPPGTKIPVWVEKILLGDEPLREGWPVAGTTGYEHAVLSTRLLIDAEGLERLTGLAREVAGLPADFAEVALATRRLVLRHLFAGEHAALVRTAAATLDLDTADAQAAVTGLLERLDVYRTYLQDGPADPADRERLKAAAAALAPALAEPARAALSRIVRRLIEAPGTVPALRDGLQRLSGPVMAKALEDTASYRWPRLLALNEVGSPIDAGPASVTEFHAASALRRRAWPLCLLASTTHDTKRGEDVRARLATLSEAPEAWAGLVARRLDEVAAAAEPDRLHASDAYTLLQTLFGIWPAGLRPDDADGLRLLAARLGRYAIKAVREAKERSGWHDPDVAYEGALERAVQALLDPDRHGELQADIAAFVRELAPAERAGTLALQLLKLTSPGVPDIYQGSEWEARSLTDPDNRVMPDWSALERRLAAAASVAGDVSIPAAKLALTRIVLDLRRRHPQLFTHGSYEPLAVTGPAADHVLAFARRAGERAAVTIVALRTRRLREREPWAGTDLHLPQGLADTPLVDLLGEPAPVRGAVHALACSFARSTVALLVSPGLETRTRDP